MILVELLIPSSSSFPPFLLPLSFCLFLSLSISPSLSLSLSNSLSLSAFPSLRHSLFVHQPGGVFGGIILGAVVGAAVTVYGAVTCLWQVSDLSHFVFYSYHMVITTI